MLAFKSISEAVNNYIEYKSNYGNKRDTFYKPKVICFKEYMLSELNLEDNYTGMQKIKELDFEHIFESMKFYVNKSRLSGNKRDHITKIGSLDDYFRALRDFFNYLNSKKLSNTKILLAISKWNNNRSEVDSIMAKIADNYDLDLTRECPPYTSDEVKALMSKCDLTIDKYKDEDVFSGQKHQNYKQLTSAIIVKLISFTGIKYNAIKSILLDDFSSEKSTIKINNYILRIPKELMLQLNIYKDIRGQITGADENKVLFIKSSKSRSPYSNDYVTNLVEQAVPSRKDTLGLSKYAIIHKYMANNIPEVLIMDLTSCGKTIINDCKKYTEYIEDHSTVSEIISKAVST